MYDNRVPAEMSPLRGVRSSEILKGKSSREKERSGFSQVGFSRIKFGFIKESNSGIEPSEGSLKGNMVALRSLHSYSYYVFM